MAENNEIVGGGAQLFDELTNYGSRTIGFMQLGFQSINFKSVRRTQ